ncbi:DUF2628 domain-containing protein [Stenotrophomonas maltophilia]|nr:DUF2628 domain-containing protein [Stenotrophomonas maltophilia]
MSNKQYSEKWQKRFAFFEKNGAPNDPRSKVALKALPNQWARIGIAANIWAFFFGPIYMATHGLWKKLISWLALSIILGVACLLLPDPINGFASRGVGFAMSLLASMSVNYAYYQKEKLGIQTWNPFQGMRF